MFKVDKNCNKIKVTILCGSSDETQLFLSYDSHKNYNTKVVFYLESNIFKIIRCFGAPITSLVLSYKQNN